MRTSRTSSSHLSILVFCLAAVTAALRAQEPRSPAAFGPQTAIASYPASGFTAENPQSTWVYGSMDYLFSTNSGTCFRSPVQLPSGIKIQTLTLEGCDTSATFGVAAYLHSCPTGLPCNAVLVVGSFGQPGCTEFAPGGASGIEINNEDHSYFLRVCNFSYDDNTKFRTVKLLYQLQLSPAPATATFADVPKTHLYFRAIEALAKSGITSGCGGGNFCPDQAVTRGEVAKFLANALGLSWWP